MAANLLARSRFAMSNQLILGVLVGAVLGMRLRAFILIPTTAFAFIAIAGIGAVRGDIPSSIAIAMVLAAISLQLGYLAGSATRFVLVASRVSRRSKIETPARTKLAGGRPTLSA
jgi:hypothetical protein